MATAPTYAAHQWEDGEVITAERLNAIEIQLEALSAEGAIGTGNIADGAVTSAKIGASAVGAGKIGPKAVATENIADKVIPTADTLLGATATGKSVMKAANAAEARTAIGAAAAE
nr:MAG: hypothetical protein [Bacteriophage sp.]